MHRSTTTTASPPAVDALPIVFTTVEARSAGITRAVLRGARFHSPVHGLHQAADRRPQLPDLVRALQSRNPDSVASHATAARLWGMWLPLSWESGPVHLSRTRRDGGAPRRRDGVVGHELSPGDGVVTRAGIRLTTPVATWAALAADGMRLEDLVAVGDSLVQRADGPAARREPGVHPRYTMTELAAGIAHARGRRGVGRLREALGSVRPGADSRPETLVRLAVVQAGFPEPDVNPWVTLSDGTRHRVDLVWPDAKVCIQYEGDHHRTDPDQWRRDIERDRRMQAEGWVVLRVTAGALTQAGRAALMADLATHLGRPGPAGRRL